jgi:hypothetical protein
VTPLKVSILSMADGAQHLVDLAAHVVSWRRPPTAWSGGRAGWVVCPAWGEDGTAALKLKGLGVAPNGRHPARPPTGTYYNRWPGQRPDHHLGFDRTGEFALLDGDPAPVGGLVASAALREQTCATALQRAGVSAVRPVAAFAYDDLALHHDDRVHPLGVSVTASAIDRDVRPSVLVPHHPHATTAEGMKDAEELRSVLDVAEHVDPEVSQLRALARAYSAFGAALRGFAQAGWYRYSGHPGNIAIDRAGCAVLDG